MMCSVGMLLVGEYREYKTYFVTHSIKQQGLSFIHRAKRSPSPSRSGSLGRRAEARFVYGNGTHIRSELGWATINNRTTARVQRQRREKAREPRTHTHSLATQHDDDATHSAALGSWRSTESARTATD